MFKNIFIIVSITTFSLIGCSNESKDSVKVETPTSESETKADVVIDDTQLVETYMKEIETYKNEGESFVSLTQNVTPASTLQEKIAQYNELDLKETKLEQKLDILEDQIEADFQATKLSSTHYQTLESTIEILEDQMDNAMDLLELQLGIED